MNSNRKIQREDESEIKQEEYFILNSIFKVQNHGYILTKGENPLIA